MAGPILPTAVVVDHIQLADSTGIPIPVPRATVRTWLSRGLSRATLTIPLEGLTLTDLDATATAAVPPAATTPPTGMPDWLRLAECARLHVTDVDGLTEKKAKDRVCYAIRTGALVASGHGMSLRIEPTRFAAWRLEQRERNLKRFDDL